MDCLKINVLQALNIELYTNVEWLYMNIRCTCISNNVYVVYVLYHPLAVNVCQYCMYSIYVNCYSSRPEVASCAFASLGGKNNSFLFSKILYADYHSISSPLVEEDGNDDAYDEDDS